MLATDLLVGLVVAVGLVGILVPLLPGSVLVVGAVLVWALAVSRPVGWAVLGVVVALVGLGVVVKYAVPGRRLAARGVPGRSLLAGGAAGVVGFFVLPVVGLPLGFVGGVYLAERLRVGPGSARTSTLAAVRAVGLSLLIELSAGLLAALTWLVAAITV
jgi:uncharacterized protein